MTLTEQMKADGWIEHDGGPCPVPRETNVRLMWRDGHISRWSQKITAKNVPWVHRFIGMDQPDLHIIAYRPEQPQ